LSPAPAQPLSPRLKDRFGQFISKVDQLQPADLVFFETYRKGPSHVGIYLGDGRFIHASTGQRKVVVSSIRSEYYAKRFLGGNRILPG
jgi:cell wall-associated NlpC family hydrolase